MDDAKPTDSTLADKVIELCEIMLSPAGKGAERGRILAEDVLKKLKGHSAIQPTRTVTRVGHRHYDRLIETLFTITTTGLPREVFLKEVLNHFDRLAPPDSKTLRLIIEADRPRPGEAPEYRGFAATGIQPERWRNYQAQTLAKSQTSRLFEQLLFHNQSVEVIHSDYLPDYAGEFNSLIDKRNAFWINAVALPSTASHYPNRSFIVLYPTAPALTEKLSLPSNALQEWRVLHFTAIAYQHLSHQLAGLAEQVAARRSELLTELAPGILHHEMGAWLGLMRANLRHQFKTLNSLLTDYEHPLLDALRADNQALYQNAARLYETVDTFNNLEQRRGREKVKMRRLFRQMLTICHHRLGMAGVELEYQQDQNYSLQTDAALLLHLMLNIVINAINAIHEHPELILQKTVLIYGHCNDSETIFLDFVNNGPPLADSIKDKLFQRGVTTRAEGHGQGLYICWMIAHYLGGELLLLEPSALQQLNQHFDRQPTFHVGFRLTLPLQLPDYKDLDSERRTARP